MARYQVPGGAVLQAYRYALDPTPAQQRALASHAGAARKAFNHMLDAVCKNLAQRAAERSYGIPDDQLTPALGWSSPALRRRWNRDKHQVALWWAENSKEAYNTGLDALARALDAWSKSRRGQRAGAKMGFPRFKSRARSPMAVRFTTGTIRVEPDRRQVTLPRLGTIKTHESIRKLARRLDNGTARILSATVSRTAQRWFVSFTVEIDRNIPGQHARLGSAIGIDLGVKTLITGVDNEGRRIDVPGPRPLRSALRRLRRASRAHSRKAKGSANRRKSAARLARIHATVANVRADALHKATSRLAARYETIVAEDLNVAGLTRNRYLARAISDQGFGRARRMLGYKTTWNGGTLILAGRFHPSSKTCSACGTVKTKLALSERTHSCQACGLVIDRDVNAAANLLKLAASGAERLNACGGTVRPSLAGHDPAKQEPGTALAGKTGTAAGQPAAANQEPTYPQLARNGNPRLRPVARAAERDLARSQAGSSRSGTP